MADHVHASMCAFMDAHVDRRCIKFLGETVHLDLYFFLVFWSGAAHNARPKAVVPADASRWGYERPAYQPTAARKTSPYSELPSEVREIAIHIAKLPLYAKISRPIP